MNLVFKGLIVGLAVTTLRGVAEANTLYIKNNDTAQVHILVEPGSGTVAPNPTSLKQVVKPSEEITLTVNKEFFDNAETFTVKGSVKVPSSNNKCGPLSFDHDYKIVFISGKLGTVICTYEVID